MRYKDLIEKYFFIDHAETGELVPFIFNKVQRKYYQILCDEYDIEGKGLTVPIREDILKARKEGFTSLILALFCADDLSQPNPTNTEVISYKDDATKAFRKRYKGYVASFFRIKYSITDEKLIYEKNESGEFIFKHNHARFYCGTASARTGQRGGTVHKQLYSEVAHYPDTEIMTAKEIVEGGMRQVAIAAGWVFKETTGNGKGNYHYKSWQQEKQGLSRFRWRFFGWREFYTEEEFKIIASEMTDADMLKQEYPENDEEAFLASGLNFTTADEIKALQEIEAPKKVIFWLELKGTNYIDQCEIIKSSLVTVQTSNPYYKLFVGIDVAKDRDKTVVTVERDSEKNYDAHGIKAIAIDSTGVGDFMPDWFERNSRWYVHRVKFSRQQKDIMYKNLRLVIKDKLTSIPQLTIGKEFTSPEALCFYRELTDLQKEVIGEMFVVHHPKGDEYHDDYADSWALAELAYFSYYGVPKTRKPEVEPAGLDGSVARLLDNPRQRKSTGGDLDYR